LIGSLLAIVFPIEKLYCKNVSAKLKNTLNISSAAAFTLFILSAIFMNEYQAFLYRGGLFLFSLNMGVLIACICHSSTFLGDILSWKPLRWIGTRSYGIYLWHYPIMVLSTPIYEIGNPGYWRVSLQLTFTCILAELSYRFIETPIRKLGLRGFYRKYLSFNIFKWENLTSTKKFSAVIAVSVIVVLAVNITSIVKNEKKAGKPEFLEAVAIVSTTEETVSVEDYKKSPPAINTLAPDKKSETNSIIENMSYKRILAIGDSVMLDIEPNLKERYTNITVDGKKQLTRP
jgi:hypothetical protein